jgi:hypothetical protein
MKLKKKLIKKGPKKAARVNCQTCDPGHKIKITPWKASRNKLRIPIPTQPNVKECYWKKNQLKKNIKNDSSQLTNPWPRSSDWDNLIERKKNMI